MEGGAYVLLIMTVCSVLGNTTELSNVINTTTRWLPTVLGWYKKLGAISKRNVWKLQEYVLFSNNCTNLLFTLHIWLNALSSFIVIIPTWRNEKGV